MSIKFSERIFLIISTIFIIISGNIALVSAQTDTLGVSLRISFSPDHVEQLTANHKIGYVWLENNTEVFYLVTTLEDVSKLYHTAIPEKIKQTERNGGQFVLSLTKYQIK